MEPLATFRLDDDFINQYKLVKPPFGFNGLGEFVYLRTYSRTKPDGTNEQWYETIRRVVEGCYKMQERHIKHNDLGWSEIRAQHSAQEMYDRMFHMKFLPPGRGLWAMGSEITEDRNLSAPLFNCSAVSCEDIDKKFSTPFEYLMDMSMLGVGVGFDTKGAGKLVVTEPKGEQTFVIPDSREGWVLSLRHLLNQYFKGEPKINFDYSLIRGKGIPIKGFGGISAGPDPLRQMHEEINRLISKDIGKPISVENIVDIMNLIGVCVVSGNLRRSALISFGEPDDENYLTLKDYQWNGTEMVGTRVDRSGHGWTSNNSVYARLGMDYSRVAKQTAVNGEPGYLWLENARSYGRMVDAPTNSDKNSKLTNPCGEIFLNSYESCNLVESFPFNATDLEDYKRTLKFAYLYAKTVTLSKTHWTEANKVMMKNRRIGCSISGIQQFVGKYGLNTFKTWCEEGYKAIKEWDKVYSDWFCIPQSIRISTIKPAGTTSLVAGNTAGMHWPEAVFHIRRVRLSVNSNLIPALRLANYPLEPDVQDPVNTLVVSFPVKVGDKIKSVGEVSIWEQTAMAAFLQRYWSDNLVSCTVSFDPETEANQIEPLLNQYQYQLKGISFLPKPEKGAYPQMPYEAITEEQYNEMVSKLGVLDFSTTTEEVTETEKYCSNDTCTIL